LKCSKKSGFLSNHVVVGADAAAGPATQSSKLRKPCNIDDEPDISLAAWAGAAPAAAAAGGGDAALTTNTTMTTAQPAPQTNASKRIKLPDITKKKAVDLEPDDILQAKIGKHRGSALVCI
jgi:hypothetical protein